MKFEYVTFFDKRSDDGLVSDRISLIVPGTEFLSADTDADKYNELMSAIVSYVYLNSFSNVFSKSDYKAVATWIVDADTSIEFVAEYDEKDPSKKWLNINSVKYDDSLRKYVVVKQIRKSRVLPTGERESVIVKNRKVIK